MKPERLDFIDTFGANQEVTIPIKSKGDLLNCWIEYLKSSLMRNVRNLAQAPRSGFSLWIGGQKVGKWTRSSFRGSTMSSTATETRTAP